MQIPKNFQFSQSNLQDYIVCPRRFELRYIRQLKWPAPVTESYLELEKHQKLGQRFHDMVHQLCLGVPVDLILLPNSPKLLMDWWVSFLRSFPSSSLPSRRFPEFRLNVPFNDYRAVGQFDLLMVDTGEKWTIYDWKTSISKVPVARLLNSVQSLLYPLLLVEGGMKINNGHSISPDQVEMVYWFPGFPENPVPMIYNMGKYLSDKQYINNLITEINSLAQIEFQETKDQRNCSYCGYRSFCVKNDPPREWTSEDNILDETQFTLEIDFDQIDEVAY